jgi:hypothetical protein
VTGWPRADDSACPDPARSGDGVRLSTEVAREILSAVNGLTFGSVEIVVHESRVVQIERRERVRLDGVPASQACKSPGRSHHKPNQAKSNPQEDATNS